MEPLVKTVNLTKKFPGVNALSGVNITLESGKITGLLGPNGSGKTTFMNIATGLSRPSKGEIYVNGLRPGLQIRNIVFYSPEHNHLYEWMTVKEAVDFFHAAFPAFNREKALELLEFMDISLSPYTAGLSRGMTARLKLALALSQQVKLLLLDEPLSGIDPASREKIVEGILKETDSPDKTIILSTHLVSEVETLFD